MASRSKTARKRPKRASSKHPRATTAGDISTRRRLSALVPTSRRSLYVLGLLGAACAVALFVGLMLRTSKAPIWSARIDGPSLSLETTSIDLGRVRQAPSVVSTISFTNAGNADLVIQGVHST